MAFDIKNLNVSADDYVTGLQNLGSNSSLGSSSGGFGFDPSILTNAFQLYSGIQQFNQSISNIRAGADLASSSYREAGDYAMAGAKFNAQVFRQAGQAAIYTANYNTELDKLQTQRQQTALARQLTDTLSSNWVIAGTAGPQINSKSSLIVQTDIINTASTQFLQNKNDALQRQSQITFQGKLTELQFENQARAAEFSGIASQKNYESQARLAEFQGEASAAQQESQRDSSMISGGLSLVTGIAGLLL